MPVEWVGLGFSAPGTSYYWSWWELQPPVHHSDTHAHAQTHTRVRTRINLLCLPRPGPMNASWYGANL